MIQKWCFFLGIFSVLVVGFASCTEEKAQDDGGYSLSHTSPIVKIAKDSIYFKDGERRYLKGITSGGEKIVIMARHAEKDTIGMDPGLSPAGEKRATLLASLMQSVDLSQIWITHFRRVYLTIQPTAQLKTVGLERYEPGNQANYYQDILNKPEGVYLLCGHSNTIPEMIELMGGDQGFIDDTEYSGMWIAVFGEKNKVYNYTY